MADDSIQPYLSGMPNTPDPVTTTVPPPDEVGQQQFPQQAPPVGGPQSQQQQPPSGMGGRQPLIYQFARELFGDQNARGYAPAPPGQPGRPISRGDATLSFLGNFLANMSQGLAAAGHGPGANLRGLAGGIQAPYQRELQQYQLGQQQQAQQSAIQEQQARAGLYQAQAEQMKNVVQTPYGPMTAALAAKIWPAEIRSETAKADTAANVAGRADVAGKQIAGRADIAQKSLTEKISEFKTTDAYRKWKTQLDNDTKIKVAEMVAGRAPAQMLQTASFADGALTMMNDAKTAMQRLEQRGVMGSLPANKVEDWIFGKGLVDPTLDAATREDIGKLRAAMGYTSSAAMRAHTGRTSQDIYHDFKSRLGVNQDWSALRGAMEETETLMTHYRDAASNANIQRIRAGNLGNNQAAPKTYSPNNPFAPKKQP